MKITHYNNVNAWYIYLHDKIEKALAVKQIPVETGNLKLKINLDYDKNGELLGIEILE